MIVVAGHLRVDPAGRNAYVEGCVPVVRSARTTTGCLAFSVTADSVDPGRVEILDADVRQYEVTESEPN